MPSLAGGLLLIVVGLGAGYLIFMAASLNLPIEKIIERGCGSRRPESGR